MKIRSILFATASVAVLASCGGRMSDVTKIQGTVVPEGITEVSVKIENVIDTVVPVTDGRFAVSVPTNVATAGRVLADNDQYGVTFIPDGTPLTVVLDETSKATSKYPKISVQEKFNAYNAEEDAVMEVYMAKQSEIYSDTTLTQQERGVKFEEYFDGFIGPYIDRHVEAAKANTDNFISILAINNVNGQIEDTLMDSLIQALTPDLQENRYIRTMRKALDARLQTAEGMHFTDFTVNSVVGMTRSIPPQPKYAEVKFSDYVGKGTYVLVDFWSPWCGPCKREIPNIKTVYEKYKGKGLEVLSLAVWERQPVQVTIDTAAELGMDWLHVNNCGSVPTDIYGVEGIPHLMLIGPDGTILKRGFHGLEAIEAAVAEYIK